MNPLLIYITAVALGNIAYWRTGMLRRLFWNHHRDCVDWLDPDDAPVIFCFLLTPMPGLVAVVNFFLETWRRPRGDRPPPLWRRKDWLSWDEWDRMPNEEVIARARRRQKMLERMQSSELWRKHGA